MERTHEAPSAASDLRWYYRHAAKPALKSSYGAMLTCLALGRARNDASSFDLEEERLDDAARAGGVARVLRGLDAETDDVLWRAYGAEAPEELGTLRDLAALGPITRAAKRAHKRSGSPKHLLEWLASFVEQPQKAARHAEVLERIERDARSMRSRALTAFISQRRRIGLHG